MIIFFATVWDSLRDLYTPCHLWKQVHLSVYIVMLPLRWEEAMPAQKPHASSQQSLAWSFGFEPGGEKEMLRIEFADKLRDWDEV